MSRFEFQFRVANSDRRMFGAEALLRGQLAWQRAVAHQSSCQRVLRSLPPRAARCGNCPLQLPSAIRRLRDKPGAGARGYEGGVSCATGDVKPNRENEPKRTVEGDEIGIAIRTNRIPSPCARQPTADNAKFSSDVIIRSIYHNNS